jgi:hypothetical protein
MRSFAWTLLIALPLLAAEPPPSHKFELLEAGDTVITYREQVPAQVAIDPMHGEFHREGCDRIRPSMEMVSPAMASLRGMTQHAGCASLPLTRSVRQTVTRTPRDPKVIRLLFIGNSLTYFNEMPELTQRIATREPRPLRVDQVTWSGMSLEQHWEKGEALKRLWLHHWDYVVLQERSGVDPIDRYDNFAKWVKVFADQARKSGAKPLLYQTYDLHNRRAELTSAFERAARNAEVQLVPVAKARYALLDRKAIDHLDDDGLHPNLAGAYLIACEVYAMIYGKSPVGLPYNWGPERKTTEVSRRSLETRRLTPEEARLLQLAAWDAVRGK